VRKTKEDSESFNDAFIFEAVEGNGCFCGDRLAEDHLDVVLELGRSSEGPEARFDRVAAWLRARPDIAEWRAGAILDLWHAPVEAFDTDPFAPNARVFNSEDNFLLGMQCVSHCRIRVVRDAPTSGYQKCREDVFHSFCDKR